MSGGAGASAEPNGRVSAWARLLARLELDARPVGMLLALASIWIGLDRLTDGTFLTPRNLYNLSVQSSVVGVMACGMVGVIVARHIDLSVGSVLGFTGMVVAVLQSEWLPADAGWAWPVAVAAGLALGAGIGAWQGYWVAYRGLPAFVVTLGGLMIFRGGAYLLTDGRTVAPLQPTFERIGGGVDGAIGASWSVALGIVGALAIVVHRLRARQHRVAHGFDPLPGWVEALRIVLPVAALVGFVAVMNAHTLPRSDVARGIPIPVMILGAAALSVNVLMRATRFGRYVFAMGGNPEAAALAGIDVRRVTLLLFALMGTLCGVAAVITTARLGAGTSSMGTLSELAVIAAAVIGGTSLAGGVGSVAGALLGALIMQSLENGMVLLGLSSAFRQVGIGAVLIAAVWLDSAYQRRRAGS
jgi:D-xylose transport system permease protein